ncbi:MAG: RNA-binding S4 domain-containing protein [Alphaproteobacteria bacterium]
MVAQPPAASQRLDKWLWHARIGRTRSAAAALVEKGKVRVNRNKIRKPGYGVKAGDVLTVAIGGNVRVLKVADFAERRGPATEAQALYVDLTPREEDGASHGEG